MATFRMVHTEFWNDPTVIEEMTPEDKYFFLYLLTNPNTTQIGIYKITKKQMAFDMGYSMETINSLLDRFLNHHKLVIYNSETREIAIVNWGKYNLNRGGKPMLDCVTSELKEVKDQRLIPCVGDNVKNESIRKIYDTYNVTYHDKPTTRTRHDDDTSKKLEVNGINGSYDTPTIRTTTSGQYKEEEQEEDKEEDKEQQQEQDKEVAEIIQFWDNNGFGFNNINAKNKLLSWFDESDFKSPKEMILKALDIASTNDRRTLGYVEGILKNWTNESILTVSEIKQKSKGGASSDEGDYVDSVGHHGIRLYK